MIVVEPRGLSAFELVAAGMAEMDAAYSTFVAFGKGSGQPAALNFGVVFSHALTSLPGMRQKVVCVSRPIP